MHEISSKNLLACPREILIYIFSFLDPVSLFKLPMACKQTHQIVTHSSHFLFSEKRRHHFNYFSYPHVFNVLRDNIDLKIFQYDGISVLDVSIESSEKIMTNYAETAKNYFNHFKKTSAIIKKIWYGIMCGKTEDVIEYLNKNNGIIIAAVLMIDKKQNTLFHHAALYGNQKIVELLASKLKNYKILISSVNKENKDGYLPFHLAIFSGNVALVEYFMQQNLLPKEKNALLKSLSNNFTSLSDIDLLFLQDCVELAVDSENIDMINFLCDKGFPLNIQNFTSDLVDSTPPLNPLAIALLKKNQPLIYFIIRTLVAKHEKTIIKKPADGYFNDDEKIDLIFSGNIDYLKKVNLYATKQETQFSIYHFMFAAVIADNPELLSQYLNLVDERELFMSLQDFHYKSFFHLFFREPPVLPATIFLFDLMIFAAEYKKVSAWELLSSKVTLAKKEHFNTQQIDVSLLTQFSQQLSSKITFISQEKETDTVFAVNPQAIFLLTQTLNNFNFVLSLINTSVGANDCNPVSSKKRKREKTSPSITLFSLWTPPNNADSDSKEEEKNHYTDKSKIRKPNG